MVAALMLRSVRWLVSEVILSYQIEGEFSHCISCLARIAIAATAQLGLVYGALLAASQPSFKTSLSLRTLLPGELQHDLAKERG